MAADSPEDPKPLMELFAMLKSSIATTTPTRPSRKQCVARGPIITELLLGLASHRLSAAPPDRKRPNSYRRSRYRSPQPTAWPGIATVFDLTNRVDELARLVGELSARGWAGGLSFIRALTIGAPRLCRGSRRTATRSLTNWRRPARQAALGQLLEGVGDYDGAFAAFERMNAIGGDDPSSPERRSDPCITSLYEPASLLRTDWAKIVAPGANMDDRPSPAFPGRLPAFGHYPARHHPDEPPRHRGSRRGTDAAMHATEDLGGFERICSRHPTTTSPARATPISIWQGR